MAYDIKSRIVPLMITDYAEALERTLVIEDTSGRSATKRQQKWKLGGRVGGGPCPLAGPLATKRYRIDLPP